HVEAVLLADREPALAERAVADDRDAIAGLAQVRGRRLHRAAAGCREEQHVRLGPEDVLQAPERARVDLAEVDAAVMHDRLGAGGEDDRRHGRRPRREEVPLLHAPTLATSTGDTMQVDVLLSFAAALVSLRLAG